MIAISTINNKRSTSRSFGPVVSREGDVPTFFEAVAPSPESSSQGGKHSPKALAFWARKNALRKLPHLCTRCVKPNANGHKQCDACRAYAAEYRARRRVTVHGACDAKTVAALERRVANLEHYFARLSTLSRCEYKRGYIAGRRLHRKAQERASYFDALSRASVQERTEEHLHSV